MLIKDTYTHSDQAQEAWFSDSGDFNTLTAKPRPSNVKTMSLSRAGVEPAANVLKRVNPSKSSFLKFDSNAMLSLQWARESKKRY